MLWAAILALVVLSVGALALAGRSSSDRDERASSQDGGGPSTVVETSDQDVEMRVELSSTRIRSAEQIDAVVHVTNRGARSLALTSTCGDLGEVGDDAVRLIAAQPTPPSYLSAASATFWRTLFGAGADNPLQARFGPPAMLDGEHLCQGSTVEELGTDESVSFEVALLLEIDDPALAASSGVVRVELPFWDGEGSVHLDVPVEIEPAQDAPSLSVSDVVETALGEDDFADAVETLITSATRSDGQGTIDPVVTIDDDAVWHVRASDETSFVVAEVTISDDTGEVLDVSITEPGSDYQGSD